MLELRQLSIKNTISRLIQESNNLKEYRQIHAQIITSPILPEKDQNLLVSRLLFSCALSHSGCLSYARDIFNSLNNPTLNFYNILIRAYASKFRGDQALVLYKQMLCNGVAPDCITIPFVVKECTGRLDVGTGRGVHGQSIKFGVSDDLFVQNSMISLYSTCGLIGSARKVFDEMLERDVVSWNSIIIGYLRSGYLDEAASLFWRMKKRNVITWNSIITGFVQGGRPKDALEFFRHMQRLSNDVDAVRPDKITFSIVLSSCASIGAIDLGRWVHSYLRRKGLESDPVIGTALVDMYGKCGCLDRAYEVFKDMPKKDTIAWTAMISVFALHGHGNLAIDTFNEMEAEGVMPSHVTFVGLLSACAHSRLVEKGRWCFNVMRDVYSIEPMVHHYACMVDILARAGLFEEAEELIRSMPMKPDEFVWGALLGGCQLHGNVKLGERIAQCLIDLEPQNHAYYVSLCDLYAKAASFDNVKRVRILMKERRVKKTVPGCSIIEVGGVVHEFSVLGSPNVMMEKLVQVLAKLSDQMKVKGNNHYAINIQMES